MKKVFQFLAGLFLVVQLPTSSFAMGITIESPTLVSLGNPFTINISANPAAREEILGFGFDLIFDTDEFVFGGAVLFGGATLWDGTDVCPNGICLSDDSSGTFVSGMVFEGVLENLLLASLEFTPRVAGNLSLGIYSDVANKSHGLFSYDSDVPLDLTRSLQFEVSDTQPVPEPSSMLLLGFGLLGLGFVSKSRRRG